MNKEFIEKVEKKVNSINILDKDPFVRESCKNLYRALLVVEENDNDIFNLLSDINKTIELLKKFDAINKEKYQGALSYIIIDIDNNQTLSYLIELLKRSIVQNAELYSIDNSNNDNKKEMNIDDINIILNSILTTSIFLNMEKIKNIKFLSSEQGYTIEVSDDNRKLYMGISEFGYVEIVRENFIDGKIVYMPDDDIVSNEENNSSIEEIYYDFIPYKQIGTIKLDLIDKNNFKPNSIELLDNDCPNTAICPLRRLDLPDLLESSKFGEFRRLFLRYNNHTIKITCSLKNFIENLNEICDDITIIENNCGKESGEKIVYSKELGIVTYADFVKEYNDYYIYVIYFMGKESFDARIIEIFNTQVPIMLQVSRKGICTLDQTPWIEYLEIGEETSERYLNPDTPEEIKKQYAEFLKNNRMDYHDFSDNSNTYLVNIKTDEYIFIHSIDFFSDNHINNCFIDLKENKIYNYAFHLNNKYEYYGDLSSKQKEKLIEYINDKDLLSISNSNQFNCLSKLIEISMLGMKNEIRLVDSEIQIFNDIVDIVFNDGNNSIENNDQEITKFAKEHGYKGAKYVGNWKEYKVYEPYLDDRKVAYIGLPLVILVNGNGEIRMSTSDEAMETLDENFFNECVEKNRGIETERLKRNFLLNIKDAFINERNKYKTFRIPNDLYLKYLEKIEEMLKDYNFENDSRFTLKNTSNIHWVSNDDAIDYLFDNIIGNIPIHPDEIPQGKNFTDVSVELDQYYKDEYVCKQEKEMLLSIINEIKKYINSSHDDGFQGKYKMD